MNNLNVVPFQKLHWLMKMLNYTFVDMMYFGNLFDVWKQQWCKKLRIVEDKILELRENSIIKIAQFQTWDIALQWIN